MFLTACKIQHIYNRYFNSLKSVILLKTGLERKVEPHQQIKTPLKKPYLFFYLLANTD